MALTERLGAETVAEVTLKDGNPLIGALSHDVVFETESQMTLDFDPAKGASLLQRPHRGDC